MILVTFWTSQKYRVLAAELEFTATRFCQRTKVYEWPDAGSWSGNTRQKPKVIARALEDHPGEAVLFVDADALLLGPVEAVETGPHDWGAYFRRWDLPYCGTMYFRNNANARRLVRLWEHFMDTQPEIEDEEGLFLAHRTLKGAVRCRFLEPRWCWMEDEMKSVYPFEEPIIWHHVVGDIDERHRRAKLRNDRRLARLEKEAR